MYKKSLLSCTAVAAIALFNVHFCAYAATLKTSEEKKLEVTEGEKRNESKKTYETIHAKGGQIIGTDLNVVGNKETNSNENTGVYVITAEGTNSVIELNTTTIKGTDSDIRFGLNVKNGAQLQMKGGAITVSDIGVLFTNSKNKENTLEDVTISSGKDDAPLTMGIAVNAGSTVALKNVTVTQAKKGIFANDHSEVTVSGGSFETNEDAIQTQDGSSVTLTDVSEITSSNGTGLTATSGSKITMTGGEVTGKFSALSAENGGHIKVKDAALKIKKGDKIYAQTGSTDTIIADGFGAFSTGESSIIELENTTISESKIGLGAKNGTIIMKGGSIKASQAGALFNNSKSNKNKLENVEISSNNDETLLMAAVEADNSSVALKNVTVTQAKKGIFANDHSEVTVSGGSFETNGDTIQTQDGSSVTLTDVSEITSSNGTGLAATSGSKITMTGGEVTGKNAAVAVQNGGHIKFTNGTLKTINSESFGAFSENDGSLIELQDTTINNSTVGLQVQKSGAVAMEGGSIKASQAGALFSNTKSNKNKLENVEISSNNDETLLIVGVEADNSSVALKNVTVTQAKKGIFANDHSDVTVSGGSFETNGDTIQTQDGSSVTLTDVSEITSSNGTGLAATSGSKITMTSGEVTGKNAALAVQNGGHIKFKSGTLKTINSESFGAFSENDGSLIELQDTTINNSTIGLQIQKSGAVTMEGGSIKASQAGALFSNTKSNKNKLENVEISSSNNDKTLMLFGIKAESSTAILNNVTVTQVKNAIFANGGSTITVSGGSFKTKEAAIYADNGSTITLNGDAKITSDDAGLYAKNSKSTITMTGGEVTGKFSALSAQNGGHIKVKDASLKIKNDTQTSDTGTKITDSFGAYSKDESSIIELENTTISDSLIGLAADSGTITMKGGFIKASQSGALFLNSKSNKNKLKNVEISSNNKEGFLFVGLGANGSTVALINVRVTQVQQGIFAHNGSTITVSGGSFETSNAAIHAAQKSSITLEKGVNIISSDSNGLYAEGPGAHITMVGGTVKIKNENAALLAEHSGKIDATNVSLTTEGKGSGVVALGKNSTIQLHGKTTINNTLNGIGAVHGGKVISEDLIVISKKTNDLELGEERGGVWTSGADSEVTLTGKTIIENVEEGLYADGGSKITSGDLTIKGGESKEATVGVGVYELGSEIALNGKTIIQNFDVGFAAVNSTITTPNGNSTRKHVEKNRIEAKKIALVAEVGGHIDLENVSATAGVAGLQLVTLSQTNPDEPDQTLIYGDNEINLVNTDIHVDNGTGIFVGAIAEKNIENIIAPSIGQVNLKNSKIYADVLLEDGIVWNKLSWTGKNLWGGGKMKEISNGTFTLSADHSILEGRSKISQDKTVYFDLKNGTKWTVKTSKKEKDADGNLLDIAQRSRSDISVLNLENSSIVFEKPTEGQYHTLHIGSGKPNTTAVYNASGNAQIGFNIAWNDGTPIADQKTDRLLIHGDVKGSTTVYINSDVGDKNSVINAADPSNIGGISLIQISGNADENSFRLANGYTTRNGLPYKYTLTGYGPQSSYGQADLDQSLFDEKNDNFWDFRLHKTLIDPASNAEELVPQTANYLIMPNALFYTGLIDMAKQNALLANIRTSVLEKEQEKQNGFFLYTYGGTGTFSSENAPRQYGYSGARLRYAALQGGINFAALEEKNTTTHFGLVGTYGQLSFTPKNMQDASKSTVNKWSLTAYGSLQHNNGVYVDALLSYGILNGDITNAIIGKTAKVKNAKMWSISTTIGKQFATHIAGLAFEPQVQLAYQHLAFKTIEDADKFTVDMNNPHQWLIRIGGRLTKTVLTTEKDRSLSFYGKLNAIKTFGDDQTIHIGQDYQLDPTGSLLEGGLGISAQLSHNVSLHGDVSYQHKLQKTGISGASFSGGVRYQF